MSYHQVRDRLHAQWGVPPMVERLRDELDEPCGVVYAVPDEQAAREFAAAEHSEFGNDAVPELREGVGWCVVVDMGPQIARAREGLW